MENQPQVVDLDISALIQKAKDEQEVKTQEPAVTADDVLKKLFLEEPVKEEKKELINYSCKCF